MAFPLTAVLGVALPVAISATALVIAWRPWKSKPPNGGWGTATGIGAGFVAGTIAVLGFKGVLPVRSIGDYLPHVATVAIVGSLAMMLAPRGLARLVIGIITCAGATALLTRIRPTEQLQPIAIVTGAIGLGMLMLWWCLHTASRANSGFRVPLSLIIALSCISVALIQSHTASLAQVCGALAATLGPVMLLAAWRSSFSIAQSNTLAIAIIAVAVLGAWRLTCFDVNPWSHAAALGSLAVPVLGILPPIRGAKPWIGTVIICVLSLALGLAAIKLSPSGFDFTGLS
jgi:hypothetical protein